MSNTYLLVAGAKPGGQSEVLAKKAAWTNLPVTAVSLPNFKMGTFDSLVKLTDDLAKTDGQIESYLRRVERTVTEADKELAVNKDKKQVFCTCTGVSADAGYVSPEGYFFEAGTHRGKPLYRNAAGVWMYYEADGWYVDAEAAAGEGKAAGTCLFKSACRNDLPDDNFVPCNVPGYAQAKLKVTMKALENVAAPVALTGDEREFMVAAPHTEQWMSADDYLAKKAWGGAGEGNWNNQKFDTRLPVANLLEVIQRAAGSLDEDFKVMTAAYNEDKTKKAVLVVKDTGNHATRDLLSVVTPDCVQDKGASSPDKDNDFIFTQNLQTVLIVVPKGADEEFLNFYEMGSDEEKIVPKSAKKLDVEVDKEGASLYRVVVYGQNARETGQAAEAFKKACRESKFIARDYPYSKEWYTASVAEQEQAIANFVLTHMRLLEAGLTAYSSLFEIWMHLKILRTAVECNLRYGSLEKVAPCLLSPDPNRMPRCRADLATILGSLADNQMDGGDEGEEFFPYVSLSLAPLSTSK